MELLLERLESKFKQVISAQERHKYDVAKGRRDKHELNALLDELDTELNALGIRFASPIEKEESLEDLRTRVGALDNQVHELAKTLKIAIQTAEERSEPQ
jgi:chromosome segregation ATPase